jgi:primary-amine oxidase
LGTIKYFDVVLSDHSGSPWVIENAVCLHEEDAGTLQKHTEYRTGKAVVMRSRRLVLSFVATVVNYEYAFYWSFYQDGTINFEVKATGELSTNLLAESADPAGHGTVVFPRVNGQYHQHIFCARIDPAVDGLKNSVAVVDVRALPADEERNPYGQGFTVDEVVFSKSTESVSDSGSSRFWKIINPTSIHPYTGKPVGWKLVPAAAFPGLLAGEGSYIRKRAGFATHSVWVTRYRDDELFAGGLFINQSKGGDDGVAKWVQRDEAIQGEDIVLWHSFGLTHIPRVEDFPIMPVE